jgi:hypothetical protein
MWNAALRYVMWGLVFATLFEITWYVSGSDVRPIRYIASAVIFSLILIIFDPWKLRRSR